MAAKILNAKQTSTALVSVSSGASSGNSLGIGNGNANVEIARFCPANSLDKLTKMSKELKGQLANAPNGSEKMMLLDNFVKCTEIGNAMELTTDQIHGARLTTQNGLKMRLIVLRVSAVKKNNDVTMVEAMLSPWEKVEENVLDVSPPGHCALAPIELHNSRYLATIVYKSEKLDKNMIAQLKKENKLRADSQRTNNLRPEMLLVLAPGSVVRISLYRKNAGNTDLMAGKRKIVRGCTVNFKGLLPLCQTGNDGRPSIFLRCANTFDMDEMPDDPERAYHEALRRIVPLNENFIQTTYISSAVKPSQLTWRPLLDIAADTAGPGHISGGGGGGDSCAGLDIEDMDDDVEDITQQQQQLSSSEHDSAVSRASSLLGAGRKTKLMLVRPAVVHLNSDVGEQLGRLMRFGGRFAMSFGMTLAMLNEETDWVAQRPVDGNAQQTEKQPTGKIEVLATYQSLLTGMYEKLLISLKINQRDVPAMCGLMGPDTEVLARYAIAAYSGSVLVNPETAIINDTLAGESIKKVSVYVNEPSTDALAATITRAGFEITRSRALYQLLVEASARPEDDSALRNPAIENYRKHPLAHYKTVVKPPVINLTQNPDYSYFDENNTALVHQCVERDDFLNLARTMNCRLSRLDENYAFYILANVRNTEAMQAYASTVGAEETMALHAQIFVDDDCTKLPREYAAEILDERTGKPKTAIRFQMFAVNKLALDRSQGVGKEAKKQQPQQPPQKTAAPVVVSPSQKKTVARKADKLENINNDGNDDDRDGSEESWAVDNSKKRTRRRTNPSATSAAAASAAAAAAAAALEEDDD